MVDTMVEEMMEDLIITTEVVVAAAQAAQVHKDILIVVEMGGLEWHQIY